MAVVVVLFCIIFLLTWPKVKKFVSKHKTPTPTPGAGKGVFPKKNFLCFNQVKFNLSSVFYVYSINLIAASVVVYTFK